MTLSFPTRRSSDLPGVDQYVGHIKAWYEGCANSRQTPYVDAALDYILQNKPAQAPVNVLWGDATRSNVMFDDEGKEKALIDWEPATLGPAELDLARCRYFEHLGQGWRGARWSQSL